MKLPPNSLNFARLRSGQPIVWITRSSGFSTSQTSLTPELPALRLQALELEVVEWRRR